MNHLEHSEQDRWVAVLQGHASALDQDTREAQGVRGYYQAVLSAQLAPHDDRARERRLRNLVQARVEGLHSPTKSNQARVPTREHPFKAWLRSLELGWHSLGAATAAVVLGVLVGPMWQSQSTQTEEWLVPSPTPSSATPSNAVVSKGIEISSTAPSPAQTTAERVQSELAKLGIKADIGLAADGWRLAAYIAPEQRASASEILKPMGISVPDDGKLKLLIPQ